MPGIFAQEALQLISYWGHMETYASQYMLNGIWLKMKFSGLFGGLFMQKGGGTDAGYVKSSENVIIL